MAARAAEPDMLSDDVSTTVDVFLSATGLAKMDLLSNSDPFAVVYEAPSSGAGDGREIFRTEVCRDTQDPKWTTQLRIRYRFEEVQRLTIKIYDEDARGSADLARHDFLGAARITMGELMGVDGGTPGDARRTVTSGGGAAAGALHLHAEEVCASDLVLEVQFRGRKLANKDGLFGRSDPYLVCHRLREAGDWTAVWKSEVVMNDLSPTWRAAQLPLSKICNGDLQRPLRFEVYDYDARGDHDYMGSFETSVEELVAAGRGGGAVAPFPVVEEKKRAKKKRYVSSGHVHVERSALLREPTFLGFLRAGLELSTAVAIDYTASNGDPSAPDSLHRTDPSGATRNHYESAIMAIGEVLETYDADRRFPVYGFGGRVGGRPVSHCFRVVDGSGDAEVRGIGGVMDVYRKSLSTVRLSGPTVFAKVIQAAAAEAQALDAGMRGGGPPRYHVLVVLTDGVINDMENTVDAIVAASALPLSIIIVGVGDADFAAMERLDGDDRALTGRSGLAASRDIVQFVPMNHFRAGRGAVDWAAVRRALLAELPDQVLRYMRAVGKVPEDAGPAAAPAGARTSAPAAAPAAAPMPAPSAPPPDV